MLSNIILFYKEGKTGLIKKISVTHSVVYEPLNHPPPPMIPDEERNKLRVV